MTTSLQIDDRLCHRDCRIWAELKPSSSVSGISSRPRDHQTRHTDSSTENGPGRFGLAGGLSEVPGAPDVAPGLASPT